MTFKIKIRWWFQWLYMPGVNGVYLIMTTIFPFSGIKPDQKKLQKWAVRAMKAKVSWRQRR